MAVDVPESLELTNYTTGFYWSDSDRRGIYMTEKPLADPAAGELEFRRELEETWAKIYGDTFAPNHKLAEEDLSGTLGRPAMMNAYYNHLEIFNLRFYHLVFHVVARLDQGLVHLRRYESFDRNVPDDRQDEIMAATRDEAVERIGQLLSLYRWTGRNEQPASGEIALSRGLMPWPPLAEAGYQTNASLHFHSPRLDFDLATKIFTAEDPAPAPGLKKRRINGHWGYEERKFYVKLDLSCILSWNAVPTEKGSSCDPLFFFWLMTKATDLKPKELPYILGLWDFVLNSMRPVHILS